MELYYNPEDNLLYCANYNHWYKVIALFTVVEDSNDYMMKHKNASVLLVYGPYIVIVDKRDKGQESV